MKSPMISAVRATGPLTWIWRSSGWTPFVLYLGESQLGDLQNYSNLAESAVVGAQKEFMAHVAEVNALKPPSDEYDDEEVPYEGNEEESLRLHNTFPTFVYSGTLIVAFSIFETHLVDLCRSLTTEFNLTVVDNPKHTPIFRAQKFLSTHFQVEVKAHLNWTNILDFQQVRNCFAHSHGNVSLLSAQKRPLLETAVKKHAKKGILINHVDRLEVTSQFVHTALDEMKGFWRDLHTAFSQHPTLGPRYWPHTGTP